MKLIVFAALITAFLAVGGVALTFAFRSPAASPRPLSPQAFTTEEMAYRAGVVSEANRFIDSTIEPLLGQTAPQERQRLGEVLARVKGNLETLRQVRPEPENNQIVEETVRLLKEVNIPQVQGPLGELADRQVKGLTVRWEPDLAQAAEGRLLYRVRCTTCHGVNGDGSPITPEVLAINPRDFTGKSHRAQKVVFKFNTSDRPDMLALDEDLKKTIKEGLPGTPMPGFATLSDEELQALVEYIKTFGFVAWKFQQPDAPALQVPPVPPDLMSPLRIDAGRLLFAQRGCLGCHGDIEQGGQPVQGLPTEWLQDGQPLLIRPRNFALEPLRRPEPQDIFQTIRLGIKGTLMPPNPLSDEETWNLVAYVLHLR